MTNQEQSLSHKHRERAEELSGALQEIDNRLNHLAKRAMELDFEAKQAAAQEQSIIEQVKAGTGSVDEITAARGRRENLARVIAEVEKETTSLMDRRMRPANEHEGIIAELQRERALAQLHELAEQANEKRLSFYETRNSVSMQLEMGFQAMANVDRELYEIRAQFLQAAQVLLGPGLSYAKQRENARVLFAQMEKEGACLSGIADFNHALLGNMLCDQLQQDGPGRSRLSEDFLVHRYANTVNGLFIETRGGRK